MDDDESDRVVDEARECGAADATAHRRHRPRIDAGDRAAASAPPRSGADAVLVRTPGFFKSQMTSDVFVRHYTAVADASPVPGAALQLHRGDRRQPAAGRPCRGSPSIRTSSA